MTVHPVEARMIGELDFDYLVDRVGLDRLHTTGEPPTLADAEARARRLDSMLRAVAELSPDKAWSRRLRAVVASGDGRTSELAALVVGRDGGRLFDPDSPLPLQLSTESVAVLDALAVERRSAHVATGVTDVVLAADLLPRAEIPPRLPALTDGPVVVEVGDLGNPLSCLAHGRVWEELGDLRGSLTWTWLYCATPRTLSESHRAGAIAERVLEDAPQDFWSVVAALAEGPEGGLRRAQEALRMAGAETRHIVPPDGTPLPPGLLHDRTMALACGLPAERPLFVVDRTVIGGVDAAAELSAHIIREASEGLTGRQSSEGRTARRPAGR